MSGDSEHVFESGDSFSLDLLRSGGEIDRPPTSGSDGDTPSWEDLRAQHVLALLTAAREAGDWQTLRQAEDALRNVVVDTLASLDLAPVDEDAIVKPYIDLLLAIRKELRDDKQWGHADAIRDRLVELGIEVQDTPDGAVWERIEG